MLTVPKTLRTNQRFSPCCSHVIFWLIHHASFFPSSFCASFKWFVIIQINQKMMKSALIKDLYSEIDRLKQGIYYTSLSLMVENKSLMYFPLVHLVSGNNVYVSLYQRYMLQGRRMESTYHVIVTLMMKLRRRLILDYFGFRKTPDCVIHIN